MALHVYILCFVFCKKRGPYDCYPFLCAIFPSSFQFQKHFRLFYYLLDQKRKTSINATQKYRNCENGFSVWKKDTHTISTVSDCIVILIWVLFFSSSTHTHTYTRTQIHFMSFSAKHLQLSGCTRARQRLSIHLSMLT